MIDPSWNSSTAASTNNRSYRQADSIRKQYFRWDQQSDQCMGREEELETFRRSGGSNRGGSSDEAAGNGEELNVWEQRQQQ